MAVFQLPGILIVLAVVGISLPLLSRLLTIQLDSKEPPLLPSTGLPIPAIGHIWNLFRKGAEYFIVLEKKYRKQIYTLQLGPSKIYVASSPEWCQAVHKSQLLSFNALVRYAMEKGFMLDKETLSIMDININMNEGHHGVMADVHHNAWPTLAPGSRLDNLNRPFLKALAERFRGLTTSANEGQINLYEWIRHNFSMASIYALYGPENIFTLNPELEPMFWEFEEGIGGLLASPFPSLTARKAYYAREQCLDAVTEYAEKARYKDASPLIQKRFEIMYSHGLTPKMAGHGELSMMFGALVNTAPASFWTIIHVVSDKALLVQIRREVESCTRKVGNQHIINATKLRSECPTLLSTIREVLRFYAPMNTNRLVLEDTMLSAPGTDETYLLKKGTMVTNASNAVHADESIWGPNASDFDARRFLREGASDQSLDIARGAQAVANGRVHPGAYRPFSSGTSLCPGRHFAHYEIIALTALFVAGFDVRGTNGHEFKLPGKEGSKVFLGVIKPRNDVEVSLRRRAGLEDVEWSFEL